VAKHLHPLLLLAERDHRDAPARQPPGAPTLQESLHPEALVVKQDQSRHRQVLRENAGAEDNQGFPWFLRAVLRRLLSRNPQPLQECEPPDHQLKLPLRGGQEERPPRQALRDA
jgi:hypothetical protein